MCKSRPIIIFLFFSLLSLSAFKLPDEEGGKKTSESAVQRAQEIFGPRLGEFVHLNLKQCLQRALTHNPDLGVADESLAGVLEKRTEVNKIGKPIVDYEYNLGPAPRDAADAVDSFFSGDLTVFNKMKIGVGVPLQTFGKVKTGKALASVGAEAEREKKVQKKAEIALKVKQLYYGILLAREVNRLLKSASDGIRNEVDKREKEGKSDPSDLLKMRLFKAELDRRLEEGRKKEILALEAMRVQMGMDPDTRFDIAEGKLHPVSFRLGKFESYKEEALANRSDLKLLDMGLMAKEMQVALEKRLMTPNLAAGGFFELGRAPGVRNVAAADDFNNPFNFTRAGIGLQLKGQFDYNASLSKVRQAKSEVRKIGIQKGYAQNGVELELKEAYLDVRNTGLDRERAEQNGKIARQLLFLTQSNYDIGVGEPKDLIEALQAFLLTRGQYFESIFNYNNAVAKFEQKLGRLLEEGEGESHK